MESSLPPQVETPSAQENPALSPSKAVAFKTRGFTPIENMGETVEEFRQYYLEQRKAYRTDLMGIFREFRRTKELESKLWFNPYPNQIKGWFKKWEMSLPLVIRKVPIKGRDVVQAQKDEKTLIKEIAYEDLEGGAKNLQSMLIDDAQQLIKESNQEYELIDEQGGTWDKQAYEKIRMKKKEVALAIATDVMSGVHKHELVNIKKNKEGRETAGFIMELMKSASAGELSDADMQLMEQGING